MGRRKDKSAWSELDGGASFALPLTLIRHRNFRRLSAHACKLLFDLGTQYTGYNNGYLCCSWTLMKDMGWNSTHTLRAAMLELEHYRIILRTQQGGRNRPHLHAFSFRKVDEKKGQELFVGPTLTPSNAWKHEALPDFQLPDSKRRKRGHVHLESVAA